MDIDSTHSDTYGQQEAVSYDAHYDTEPILVFDSVTDLLLAVKQHPVTFILLKTSIDFYVSFSAISVV
ncbi:hypothetical protein ACA584_04205 [Lactiplantibacillus plantarum]|nr:hypothetical protein CFI62_05345 [Lactiplantibacillus plantarum]